MQVDMLTEVLAPGVKYRRHTELTVQALRVFTKASQGVPDCLEQDGINLFWVKLRPRIKLMRNGKHHMEVRHG